MAKAPKPTIVKQPNNLEEEVIYRLSLLDSKSRSIQVDVEHHHLIKMGRNGKFMPLLKAYELLLDEDLKDKSLTGEPYKQVKEKLHAVRAIEAELMNDTQHIIHT